MKKEIIKRRIKSEFSKEIREEIKKDTSAINQTSKKISLFCNLITNISAILALHYLIPFIKSFFVYALVILVVVLLMLLTNNILYYISANIILKD